MAIALNALGVVGLRAKTWEAARRYFEEAQTFFKATGNRAGVLMTLGNLGMVVSGLGQYVEAKQRYQEALTLSLEIGDRWMRGALLDSLGDVTYTLGDDTEAARNFGESLRLVLEVGAIPSALLALAGIAKFRVRAGNPDQALELLGLVLHHPACDDETRQRAEPLLAELRAVLPPEVVEAALERGRARTVEEVAAEILGTG